MLPQCQHKKKLTVKPADGSPAYFTLVDCGKCFYCRKRHALDWARRCMDEAEYWQDGCFLTLTYSPEKVPMHNGLLNLSKRDIQLWLKRLRESIDCKIAYFAVGEYGSKRGRPHYHAIIFGWSPPDATYLKSSYSGYPLYKSAFLEKTWQNGLCFVGLNFTRDCAAYCAKYCDKKIFRPDEFFKGRQAEFQLSSRNILGQGAIGARWCRDNFSTVQRGFLNDKSTPSVKLRLPKYYYDLYKREVGDFPEFAREEPEMIWLHRTQYQAACIESDIAQRILKSPRQFDDETVGDCLEVVCPAVSLGARVLTQ